MTAAPGAAGEPAVPPGLRSGLEHAPPEQPGGPSGAEWLDRLPRLAGELLADWDLMVDGAPAHGQNSLVLPVRARRRQAAAAVLKVTWPHPEAAQEHLALRSWGGRDAVRLLAADPARWALLLERLDARDLDTVGILDCCEQVGTLLRRLDRPAPPWAPRLSDHLRRLVADTDAAHAGTAGRRFPRRMLLQARDLAAQLASEPGVDERLVHTDLHGQNVLWRPDPGQWVAIDPKVMAADPAFAVAPVLWNRWEEAEGAHDVRIHLNLRLETVCDAAGTDPDRARAFGILRMVRNALWALADDPGPGTSSGTQRWLTRAVTVVKALQPG